jgi:hypothetical protein
MTTTDKTKQAQMQSEFTLEAARLLMVEAQRAEARGEIDHDTVLAAQRAYEQSRRDEERAVSAARHKAECEAAQRVAMAALAAVRGRPLKPHVGLCSRKRAEHWMMAPAVAGTGAIYVDLETPVELGSNYICRGTVGDEVVAERECSDLVIAVLIARLSAWSRSPYAGTIADKIEDMAHVLSELVE